MDKQAPAKLLLDVGEVAEILGIGRSLAYAYVMRGEIRSLKLGRRRKIRLESVQEFIARREAEAEEDF